MLNKILKYLKKLFYINFDEIENNNIKNDIAYDIIIDPDI